MVGGLLPHAKRIDDNYVLKGDAIYLYNPQASRMDIIQSFHVFCRLAVKHGVIPKHDWQWSKLLKIAAKLLGYAFEKSDAKKKYGSENIFNGLVMGGRSLRCTGQFVYGSELNYISDEAEVEIKERRSSDKLDTCTDWNQMKKLFADVGGVKAWQKFVNLCTFRAGQNHSNDNW